MAALNPVTDFRVKDMAKSLVHVKVHSYASAGSGDFAGGIQKVASSKISLQTSPKVIRLNTDQYNSIYWVDLAVHQTSTGYNQTFPLLLDTGSAIAWIANSSCQSQFCTRAPRFTTSTVTPTEFSLDYSTGKITGLLIDSPKSNISYSLGNQLPANNFSCGLAATVPSFFANYNISGILGLSANASAERGTNLVQQLYAEKTINSLKFSIILGAPSGANDSSGGFLLLGDMVDQYAPALAQSQIQSRPVVPNVSGYWMVNVLQVTVMSAVGANVTFPGKVSAVFDTGTTGLALPLNDATTMHLLLFGSLFVTDGMGNYAFPCNTTGSVTLNIDGLFLTISVDLIRADEYTSAGLQGLCSSKMQGLSTPNWILGASFLKNFYTVFDIENRTVGFAPRVALYSYAVGASSSSTSKTSTASLTALVKSSTSTGASSTRAAGTASDSFNLSPWTIILLFLGIF